MRISSLGPIGMSKPTGRKLSRRILGGALVAGVVLGLGAAPALAQKKAKEPKAAKGAKGQPATKFSKEFSVAAQPLQISLEAARVARAKVEAKDPVGPAELATALAAAKPQMALAEAAIMNADDRLVAGQFQINLGGYLNDIPMRQRGAKNMLDSAKLEPTKVAEFQYYLGNFAYANKDYPTAQTALAAAIAAGHPQDDTAELLADSYAKANNPKGGLDALRKAVDARIAAGKPIPASWLKRANTIAYNNKLGPEAIDWAILQVKVQPSNFNWLGSAQLVRQFSGFGPQETLDLFRLMLRSGALDNEAKFVSNEYKEYIEAADPRRLPGEVVKVIDKGTAAGALSGGWVSEARATANGRIAADKASLGGQANTARDGNGVAAVADAYLNYGDAAKAEELYAAALAKGATDKDRVLTRLGIAQVDQGKWAAARDSFSKVAGTRNNLARLWLIYVAQKSGGAA